jgi:hypothetical protein
LFKNRYQFPDFCFLDLTKDYGNFNTIPFLSRGEDKTTFTNIQTYLKKFSRLCIGLSNGSVKKGTCLGRTENTYAMQDDKCDYCLLSGHERLLEWPLGAVKPKWTGTGCEDVFGCGIMVSAEADDKLAIFFTTNGTLMGKWSK